MTRDEHYGMLAHALFHAVQDSRLTADFDIDGTIAALARDADVRTLDDWVAHVDGRHCAMGKAFGLDVTKLHDLDLWGPLGKAFDGATPDEARAKAAAWVREQPAATETTPTGGLTYIRTDPITGKLVSRGFEAERAPQGAPQNPHTGSSFSSAFTPEELAEIDKGVALANGHRFLHTYPTNCDKCGIQFGARFTRACEVVK